MPLVSLKNTFVFVEVFSPPALSAAWARKNTSLSGNRARTQAANKEIPAAVQKRLRQPAATTGTSFKLMQAARR
jgi:hypothetical protein